LKIKHKGYIVGILFGVLLLGAASFFLYREYVKDQNSYSELEEINIDQVFDLGGSYYIYFQRAECPYCDNVRDDIIDFSKKERVYMLDTRAEGNENLKDYDWDTHEQQYDKEIGEVKDGEAILYDGITADQLEEVYSPQEYTIQAREDLNDSSVEKIYAILEAPVIDFTDVSPHNLIVPAVPYMIYVENGIISQDYFGDTQILVLLESTCKPLDEYIQVEQLQGE